MRRSPTARVASTHRATLGTLRSAKRSIFDKVLSGLVSGMRSLQPKRRRLGDTVVRKLAKRLWVPGMVDVKVWTRPIDFYRYPRTVSERDNIIRNRLVDGRTFMDGHGMGDIESARKAFWEQAVQHEELYPLFSAESVPLEASAATEQFCILDHTRNYRLLEMKLSTPTDCRPLKDRETADTLIKRIFNTAPDEKLSIYDLSQVVENRYMYCFSREGVLRMVQYDSEYKSLSKHLNICDDNACCAGVLMPGNGTTFLVDRLSGTYEPPEENFDIFTGKLRDAFPTTNIISRRDLRYLDGSVHESHPDYSRYNS